MIKKQFLLLLACASSLFTNCKDDDKSADVKTTVGSTLPVKDAINSKINSFIYRGLNEFYLYKEKSPDLANNRFSSINEKNNFTSNGGRPEAFFDKLLYDKDRFSFIVDDFNILEDSFKGESLNNGLKFRLIQYDGDDLFIIITDVIKNSPAANAGIKRGMLFNKINGTQMNINNQAKLFEDNSFTIEEAIIVDNTIIDNGNTISLTKVSLTENPIGVAKVIDIDSHKIGYLMYNSFLSNFEEELNNEFGKFKTEGVTDFVLDVRYNGGGSVDTANILSGMITGNLTDKVFSKGKWNKEIQEVLKKNNPEELVEKFKNTTLKGTKINTLGLSKLYVITSKQETASSSELVINSLKPYIEVVVIGEAEGTVGKSQGSITLYDSPDFLKEKSNTSHNYVMQPLVIETVNSNGVGIPIEGIKPNLIVAEEGFENLGVLGDVNEPLLKVAINAITGKNIPSAKKINKNFGIDIGGSQENSPTYQRMYFTN